MKHSLLFFSLLFSLAGTVCSGNLCTINGVWNKKSGKEIKLFAVENGALKEIASTRLDESDGFFFNFEPKQEAFFVIGNDTKVTTGKYTFYFKPGDKLSITVNEDNSYTLTGNNTPENGEMARWHEFMAPLEKKSVYEASRSTYVDFFPLLEEKLAELAAGYKPEYTKNKTFAAAFEALREYDMLFHAMHYLKMPHSAHPQGEDFPDYYRNISVANFTASPRLLEYPFGAEILSTWLVVSPMFDTTLTDEQKSTIRSSVQIYDITVNKVSDKQIKGELTLLATGQLRSPEGLSDFEKKYGKHLATDDQRQRMARLIQTAGKKVESRPAADFSFPDLSGMETSLSDFKGKVVYIDVWATWCVPCRKELPFLKELEQEYHGKDVVFMSISVDAQKDYAKWERFVADNQMKGVQLFAGDKANTIRHAYEITGIPHFILVGKDGGLIQTNAPRPSSSEIKVVLDAALKK